MLTCQRRPTKQEVLRTMMSIFAPLQLTVRIFGERKLFLGVLIASLNIRAIHVIHEIAHLLTT